MYEMVLDSGAFKTLGGRMKTPSVESHPPKLSL